MSNLSDEYQKIMNNLEKQITDQEQLELVKNSIANLTVTFMDTVDKVLEYSDEKLNNLEEKQQDLEERLSRVQKIVDNIEKIFMRMKTILNLKLFVHIVIINL